MNGFGFKFDSDGRLCSFKLIDGVEVEVEVLADPLPLDPENPLHRAYIDLRDAVNRGDQPILMDLTGYLERYEDSR